MSAKQSIRSGAAALVLAGLAACASGEGGPATGRAAAAAGVSDPAAALADATMEKMGGRDAWDGTRCLGWTFFGARTHLWDKHTGDIRVEGTRRETEEAYVVAMNLNTGAGRAWVDGVEVTEPAALAEMLDGGRRAWINDSYWLVMPYKLRDPGVTLRLLEPRAMVDGRVADVLELTFVAGIGVTPENKYHVYVARDSGLVEQWDFFPTADAAEPRFRIPWQDWRPYGAILLSGDRGENRRLDGIAVYDAPPIDLSGP